MKAAHPSHGFRRPRQAGFTLIEMMVVTIVIGILVGMGYANLIKAQSKAKVASVIDNMHTIQIAAEAYATDTAGLYGPDGAAIGPYLPNGSNSQGGSAGIYPTNPLTMVPAEVPFTETIADSAGIASTRSAPPTASPGTEGQVGYNQCDAPECTSYAVTGTNDAGRRIGGATTTLVLSNH